MQADIDARLFKRLVHSGALCFAGNRKLKIYGRLNCATGKRMKKENRVFFSSESEALSFGYRPCGHCMRQDYRTWTGSEKNLKTGNQDGGLRRAGHNA